MVGHCCCTPLIPSQTHSQKYRGQVADEGTGLGFGLHTDAAEVGRRGPGPGDDAGKTRGPMTVPRTDGSQNRRLTHMSRHASPEGVVQPGLVSQHAVAGPSSAPANTYSTAPPTEIDTYKQLPSRHHHHRAPLSRQNQTPHGRVFSPSDTASGSQRREGRTVPISSEMFKRDREKDARAEATENGGGALGAWAKQHDPRSTAGAMEARLSNGHSNGNGATKDNPVVTEPRRGEFPPNNQYVVAGDHLAPGGGGYAHLSKGGSVLSPPMTGPMAGELCGRRWMECVLTDVQVGPLSRAIALSLSLNRSLGPCRGRSPKIGNVGNLREVMQHIEISVIESSFRICILLRDDAPAPPTSASSSIHCVTRSDGGTASPVLYSPGSPRQSSACCMAGATDID